MPTDTVLRSARNWGLGILVLLNVLDIATTYVALHHGALEGNPIARSIIGHGFGWVIFSKALMLAFLAYCVVRIDTKQKVSSAMTALAVWTVVGAYLMVVTTNFATLQRLV